MKLLFAHHLVARKHTAAFFAVLPAELYATPKDTTLSPADSVLPMLGGLLVILILIFGLAHLFKRFSNFNLTGRSIQVIETQSIGQKEKIMIIQVRDQQFLLGVTGQSINQLGELKIDRATKQVTDEGSHTPAKPSKHRSTFSAIMLALTKPNFKSGSQEDRSATPRRSGSIK